jgi:hypothetical protein
MPQLLLLPDPKPLVERLGADFFRQAPTGPGVYIMRAASGAVLYVGKAKNLRKRLASYRVANPERLPRRQLRLLRAVERIELHECDSEAAALARESGLLRSIRPKFNRAGTWPAPARLLAWQITGDGIAMRITETSEQGWRCQGPLGSGAVVLRTALLRVMWRSLYNHLGTADLPEGWFRGRCADIARILWPGPDDSVRTLAAMVLEDFFAGDHAKFRGWVKERTASTQHPFEVSSLEADLETVTEFAKIFEVPALDLETLAIGSPAENQRWDRPNACAPGCGEQQGSPALPGPIRYGDLEGK